MKGIKALFADSIQELKDLRTLAVTAMLLAIAVVLGFYTLQLTDYIKIGFAYIANETTGMLFGPAVGGIEISCEADRTVFSGVYHQRHLRRHHLRDRPV